MHHMSRMDNLFFRWQLQKPEFLTPLNYNTNNWRYNEFTGNVERADIATDKIIGLNGVTVREMFLGRLR